MWLKGNTPDQFHSDIEAVTKIFIKCFKEKGMRACAYNHLSGKVDIQTDTQIVYVRA